MLAMLKSVGAMLVVRTAWSALFVAEHTGCHGLLDGKSAGFRQASEAIVPVTVIGREAHEER
jgi:hypothetical protein